ncbi:MAG TPA: hypothetical protein VMP86_05645 [Candidatus Binatia bacterium]|nr:hypothetical protein [Candidatus Binatia bacterium]
MGLVEAIADGAAPVRIDLGLHREEQRSATLEQRIDLAIAGGDAPHGDTG